MPRAFLIKKHSPCRESVAVKQRSPSLENELSNSNTSVMEFIPIESKGPYDLRMKYKKSIREEEEEETCPAVTTTPSKLLECSPRLTPFGSSATLAGIALYDPPTPSYFFKTGSPLEPLNPNTASKPPLWQRCLMSQPCSVFPFPVYPLARHATEFSSSSPTYIAPTLVPPPLISMSPPSTMMEKSSLCIQRENTISPSRSPSTRLTLLDIDRCETALSRHDMNAYLPPWIHKEPSISPIPASDSSDSSFDNGKEIIPKREALTTDAQMPRYQCIDCSKSYSTYSGLSRHRQFHCVTQGKKAFHCKYCDKVYVSLGALKMHIRTHTLPCKCKLCGKAFSRPWLLQGHIRTHTGEKPFACSYCNRAFADRSNLRAHLQTHSDVKKYNCKACGKTFSRMSLLLKHCDGGCLVSSTS